MNRSKPAITPLHTLTPGQIGDFFALLKERTRGETRESKPYYTCRFGDVRRSVTCMVWFDTPWFALCENEWQDGVCYKIRARYQEHDRYGAQIELQNIRKATDADRADGFDPAQIVESSRFSADAMFEQLLTLVRDEIKFESLRELVLLLLNRHAAQLKELPASEGRYYPFRGGWLEHVVSLSRTSLMLSDHYIVQFPELKPPLNRDLILAGAILHGIGRVLEFTAEVSSFQPTVQGRLVGHLLLGRDMIRDAAGELGNVPPDMVQLLEHLVLTYLALPEWGSPRLPMIPEAILLHHAVDLDAKMEMYARCLSRDTNSGPFTVRDPMLGKALLKQRSV